MLKIDQGNASAAVNGEASESSNNNYNIIGKSSFTSDQQTLFDLDPFKDYCGSIERKYTQLLADALIQYVDQFDMGTLEEAIRHAGIHPPAGVSLNSTHALAPKIALKQDA